MEDRMRQATHERQVRISRRKRSYELLASRAGYSPKGEPPNLRSVTTALTGGRL